MVNISPLRLVVNGKPVPTSKSIFLACEWFERTKGSSMANGKGRRNFVQLSEISVLVFYNSM